MSWCCTRLNIYTFSDCQKLVNLYIFLIFPKLTGQKYIPVDKVIVWCCAAHTHSVFFAVFNLCICTCVYECLKICTRLNLKFPPPKSNADPKIFTLDVLRVLCKFWCTCPCNVTINAAWAYINYVCRTLHAFCVANKSACLCCLTYVRSSGFAEWFPSNFHGRTYEAYQNVGAWRRGDCAANSLKNCQPFRRFFSKLHYTFHVSSFVF